MAPLAAITWLRGAIDGPQVRFLFENPDDPVTLGLDPQDAEQGRRSSAVRASTR